MEKLFTKTQEFRQKATAEDYENLLTYYLKARSSEWKEEECPYGFSRSSATNLLNEKGLLEEGNDNTKLDLKFHPLVTKQHTIYVTDEVWNRLNTIYEGYECVDKKNVLDAFLRKCLDIMGA